MDLRLTNDPSRPLDQIIEVRALTPRGQAAVTAMGLGAYCSWEDLVRIKAVAQIAGFEILRD